MRIIWILSIIGAVIEESNHVFVFCKQRKVHGVHYKSSHSKKKPNNYLNWVEKGAVTAVQDEKGCNASYAFAAVSALESRLFIKRRKLTELSVQNVIDCSRRFGNEGCDFGRTEKVYRYIIKNKGINDAFVYPYEAQEHQCRYKADNKKVKMSKFHFIFGEDKMKDALSSGPIAVEIDARPETFRNYISGIYNDPECGSHGFNHAVSVVGYGTDPFTGVNYWLLKNSWGQYWGENGYMKMIRGIRMCNIGYMAVAPIVS